MLNKHFSAQRVGLLIRSELTLIYKRNLLILAGLLAFNLIYFLYLAGNTGRQMTIPEFLPTRLITLVKYHFYGFPISLLGGGFILTSLAFWELRRKDTRQFFISLPAGTLEKGLAKWMITGVLFPIVWLLAYQLIVLFAKTWMMQQGFTMVSLSLLNSWAWLWIGVYVLLQSIFFLGAIVFPRYSLIKTIFILLALGIAARLIYGFTLNNIYPLFFPESGEVVANSGRLLRRSITLFGAQLMFWLDQMPAIFLKMFLFCLFPLLSYVSYLKLSEKEL